MIARPWPGVYLAAVLALRPVQAGPPSTPVTLSIPVAVVASDGRTIRGLTTDQFSVRLGDDVARVTEVVEGPDLAISLLLDLSGSMQHGVVAEVRSAVRQLPELLRPRDLAAVNWFGSRVATDSAFARDRSVFDLAEQQIVAAYRTPLTPSPLWDAMNGALGALSRQPQRRVLLVWTDGRPTNNVVPFDVVLRHAVGSAATVIFLMSSVPPPIHAKRLDWIGDATGGYLAGLGSPRMTLKKAVEDVIKRLQSDYLLRVEAKVPSGTVHTIDVAVKAPEFLVRAPLSVLAK